MGGVGFLGGVGMVDDGKCVCVYMDDYGSEGVRE